MKLFDCITFYDENLITNARFEILDHVIDYHVICESKFDHSGNQKKLNFKLLNKKFKNKIIYLVIDQPFQKPTNQWDNEKTQRNFLFNGIKTADPEDIILFSDSDEIPDPKKLIDFELKKKYAIFFQSFHTYKINILNKHETPWEGTRAVKRKNLKCFNYLRKKILSKNIKKNFFKFYIEKDIEIIKNGGWHYNNLYSPEQLAQKIKVSPHQEFNKEKYYNLDNIRENINMLKDLYGKGFHYEKIDLDDSFPTYILKNKNLFKDYIL